MAERGGLHFIKRMQALSRKKGRDEQKLFVVEGEKFVEEIPPGWPVAYFILSDTFARKTSLPRYENRAPTILLEDALFKKLSDTATPQGIMGVCGQIAYSLADMLGENCLLLLGEMISDPGNIGTLIRTADAAGANGVIFTQGSADIFNPKIVRAAAGSIFHLPILENADPASIAVLLKNQDVLLLAAHLKGAILPYDVDMRGACCILIGNESRGLSSALSNQTDIWIKLPMSARADSLNASVAGGILLYEAVRQRIPFI